MQSGVDAIKTRAGRCSDRRGNPYAQRSGSGAGPTSVRRHQLWTPLALGTTIDILARLYGGNGCPDGSASTAPADGYTLLLVNSGNAILGTLNKNLPFDPVRDFASISLIGETAAVVVPPFLGTRTLKAFVDLARAKQGTINYASAGIGTATHLAGAYFAKQAGIEMVHVPYKTGSALVADLVQGRVQATFSPVAFMLAMLQEGKLPALAVSTRDPMVNPIMVPTALSADIDYEYATW
jgi:tripartite-type tricarboxylate transporter receptor subunit TctC